MSRDVPCGALYESPEHGRMFCTKPATHNGEDTNTKRRHSWMWVVEQDRKDREARGKTAPSVVEVLLDNIASGEADPYIEALLAALHGRKRALRGVPHPFGVVSD
jgi:hypothetical protein